jgi:hypothetical protein
MNPRLLPAVPWLLSCALATGVAQAQITPTRTEIRLWEQEGNAVAPPERRFYSTRYDAVRSRYIGFEITMNHLPAKATGVFPVTCDLLAAGEDKALKSLSLEVEVVTGAVSSNGIGLLGPNGDSGWLPGNYRVRCSGRGSLLGEAPFEIAVNPPDATEIDLHVAAIHLFPVSGALPARGQREYATHFNAHKTSRIGVELEFAHSAPGRALSIPIDCYYYPPSGRVMGPISFSYEPQADATSGYAGLAMGWDSPGQWSDGYHTAVCNIRGRPVAIERFLVD